MTLQEQLKKTEEEFDKEFYPIDGSFPTEMTPSNAKDFIKKAQLSAVRAFAEEIKEEEREHRCSSYTLCLDCERNKFNEILNDKIEDLLDNQIMEYTKFKQFMRQFILYAGKWHDESCSFVFVDHAVCNCKTHENEGKIKQFFEDLLSNR